MNNNNMDKNIMDWNKLLSAKRGSGGRRSENDLRSEFRRDYHRIIGSASFRRLQDKTQVFPLDRGDFVRTRLTHSLEVASFGKSLGQSCFTRLIDERIDPTVTDGTRETASCVLECAGLIHDIGNPPFGHFGETAIREWFADNLESVLPRGAVLTDRMRADLLNFEGNAQALRLLTKLHYLVDEKGMHLTYALLNTIIKYPVPSTGINKKSGNVKDKKMGYFLAEDELFRTVTSETGAGDNRYPLAYLLEAADDIAYKTADIEDAVKKGLLGCGDLMRELESGTYRDECKPEELPLYDEFIAELKKCRDRAQSSGISSPDVNAVQNWIIAVQTFMLGAATDSFVENYHAIMSGTFGGELLGRSRAAAIANALGDIAYRYAFCSKQILKLEIEAGTILDYLLGAFVPAAVGYDTDARPRAVRKKLISIISENYKMAYRVYSKDKDETEKLYLRLLLVTDYICGMTDGYARRLYRELNGI